MGLWYPNRRQWWVIWIAYVAYAYLSALLAGQRSRGLDGQLVSVLTVVTRLVVIGAVLLVWRLAKTKAEREKGRQ